MTYKVQLTYFRSSGNFLATVETVLAYETIAEIWEEVADMRRLGRLPGLRQGAGRELIISVDVPDHPQRALHLIMPPFVDEDDVTPQQLPTGFEATPRTKTSDIVQPFEDENQAPLDQPAASPDSISSASDDEITPVEIPFPRKPRK